MIKEIVGIALFIKPYILMIVIREQIVAAYNASNILIILAIIVASAAFMAAGCHLFYDEWEG